MRHLGVTRELAARLAPVRAPVAPVLSRLRISRTRSQSTKRAQRQQRTASHSRALAGSPDQLFRRGHGLQARIGAIAANDVHLSMFAALRFACTARFDREPCRAGKGLRVRGREFGQGAHDRQHVSDRGHAPRHHRVPRRECRCDVIEAGFACLETLERRVDEAGLPASLPMRRLSDRVARTTRNRAQGRRSDHRTTRHQSITSVHWVSP